MNLEEISLEEIRKGILSGKPIEELIKKFGWREFEQLVAEIFLKNGYRVKQSFRFKTERRYEIDLIAVKVAVKAAVLCVDCKQWSRGRCKKAGLKRAVAEQEKRIKEFKKFIKGNPVAQSLLKIDVGFKKDVDFKFCPLIVTWVEEDLIKEGDCLVVPIWKLNSFLLDIEKYL